MLIKSFSSGTELWENIALYPLTSSEGLEFNKKGRAHSRQNFLTSGVLSDLNIDLSHLGFTISRWNRFLKQYFLRDKYQEWLVRAGELDEKGSRLDIFLPCKETFQHKGGNCVLGFSFCSSDKPVLTLYSRTALFPTTGAMELIMSSLCCRDLEGIMGRPVSFCWFIGTLQWRFLHMMPYATANDLKILKTNDFLKHTWWRLFTSTRELKYGPIIRIRKTITSLLEGKSASVMSQSLSLGIELPEK